MLNNFKIFRFNGFQRIKGIYQQILWLILRSRGIQYYLKAHEIRKLHLGAGPNALEGWLNTDLTPQNHKVYSIDVTKPLPFEDNTFDYIFGEHLIEHLTYKDGLRMVKECYRVLKPGGKIRIATPDIDTVLKLRTPEKSELQLNYIKWHIDHCLPEIGIYKDIFVINSAFNNFGHKFLYDYDTLQYSFKETGYIDITRCRPGESSDENLCGIDFRARDEMTSFTNLIVEGTHLNPQEITLPDATNNISFSFDRLIECKKAVEITGWAYINGKSSENNRIYIILRSEKRTYIFETVPQKRIDVTAHFNIMNLNFDDSGFSTIINISGIEKENYRIGIYIEKDKEKALNYTDKTITI